MKTRFLFTAVTSAALVALAGTAAPTFADTNDLTNESPYYYTERGAELTNPGVGQKATTDSGINFLPAYYGTMQTNNTHRFVNINEQVFTMVGDGKHGLWRYQDNGTIREYLTDEAEAANTGLAAPSNSLSLRSPAAMDDFVAGTTAAASLATIVSDYTHFDVSASFGSFNAPGTAGTGGYKSFVTGGIQNDNGHLNFIDLPITHPKYNGRYDAHPPIDLAGYYCTMSGPNFVASQDAMKFAFTQPGANVVGPLGVRAGLDIRENYLNVLRLDLFPDAEIWASTGSLNNTVYQAIDTSRRSRTDAEIYLVERPFFNEEYLFVIAVFDDGRTRNSQFSYVRPDGTYYDSLVARQQAGERLTSAFGAEFAGDRIRFQTRLTDSPRFNVYRERPDGTQRRQRGRKVVQTTTLYGVHHPGGNAQAVGTAAAAPLTVVNGACPAMGGDFGEDFWGGAWPNNYQEVTPLCEGVMIDVKLFTNLDNARWDRQSKNQANAGTGATSLPYINDPSQGNTHAPTPIAGISPAQVVVGEYGNYTDPYLLSRNITNPEAYKVTDSEFTATTLDGRTVYTTDVGFTAAVGQVAVTETLPAGEEQNTSRRRVGQN